MSVSIASSPPPVLAPPVPSVADEFRLDIRIVERGPAAAALLGDTDDGCDTVRGSDC
ncbi:FxLD family lanthipeptide [Frankia sp. AiPa1]|uniref:FxLD family lanthipeptide n=1 Tax=Frankia sp. AiPa1 TaxID=573492 RepID=UPI00202B5321|nr:FxLD family lanthipeptide [Frankia sp. AiPa1]MCL9758831.1 FxLD family lanthipeptide [Frankia sp. AiPa1]